LPYRVRELDPVPYTTTKIVEKTGDWRVHRPEIRNNLCKKCGICVDFCPDIAIFEVENWVEVDYDYCKGCGICANECPYNAIRMVEER
jgi:2-oxoacid:acceptor oxidoreductase delta subunit (pyruvate/2-ketoisovalerate family)